MTDTQKLAIVIGISGSGKSTFARHLEDEAEYLRICPDDIRKELTGDVSDQSQNGRVWKTAYQRLTKALADGRSVVFDSTAVRKKTRTELLAFAEQHHVQTIAYMLMDSLSKERCRDRVAADLDGGIDRSNTLAKDVIIEKQHAMFLETVRSIETEGFDTVVRVG